MRCITLLQNPMMPLHLSHLLEILKSNERRIAKPTNTFWKPKQLKNRTNTDNRLEKKVKKNDNKLKMHVLYRYSTPLVLCACMLYHFVYCLSLCLCEFVWLVVRREEERKRATVIGNRRKSTALHTSDQHFVCMCVHDRVCVCCAHERKNFWGRFW